MKTFRFALMIMAMFALSLSACGDGSDELDPTDPLASGGSIDEEQCKHICEIVGSCILDGGDDTFTDSCRQSCDQSGYFQVDVINCIQAASCDEACQAGCEGAKDAEGNDISEDCRNDAVCDIILGCGFNY